MIKIRRLQNKNAGFIDDVSNIIAAEVWKNPSLVPDLSNDKTLFIFSDYSRVQGQYKTYSFLAIGRTGADYFNGARKIIRRDFNLKNRRMSYKGLNDKIKLKALPAFLSCAEAMEGLIVTFAVDNQIKYMFAEQFIDLWPELSEFKKSTLEEILRVVHFGAQVIMTAFSSGQNIIWFTDNDAVVANESHEQLFGKLAESIIRHMFMPQEKINQVVFGISEIDDGSLEVEDFLAIPDLVAGAICETLDQFNQADLRVTSKVILNKPDVKAKTDMICQWIGNDTCSLKKFGVVFDKIGSNQWDFRPTFFSIKNSANLYGREAYNVKKLIAYTFDPIRFDVED